MGHGHVTVHDNCTAQEEEGLLDRVARGRGCDTVPDENQSYHCVPRPGGVTDPVLLQKGLSTFTATIPRVPYVPKQYESRAMRGGMG